MSDTSKKLSIGFLYDDTLDNSDGVAQYVKTLGPWLQSQGHEVSYLVGQTKTKQWSGGKIYSLARNVKVSFNGNRLSIPLPANKNNIKQVLDNVQLDILHVQVPYSPFMAQRVIKAASPNTAILGTFHILPANWLASLGSRVLRLIYGRSLGRFSRIFSVSLPAQQFARAAFKIDSEVLPNVIDTSKFKAPKQATSSYKQIIFLGRLVERKGVGDLLKAFNGLARINDNVRLKIAGDGPLRKELENYVSKNMLSQKVDFLGFIKEEDKSRLLSGADIACFPSLYGESFGIVLIEAMAAGAGVVVGGNNAGYRSLLSAQPKLLVDPKNTAEFTKRLNELLSDRDLARKLHGWQSEHVKQYDVAVVGKQLLGAYQYALAKRPEPRHN